MPEHDVADQAQSMGFSRGRRKHNRIDTAGRIVWDIVEKYFVLISFEEFRIRQNVEPSVTLKTVTPHRKRGCFS
jgi:hypothetical protein